MSTYPGPTYADLIVNSLERHGDRPFLVGEGRALTYREGELSISRVLQALRGRGVTKGTGVAVLSSNRPEAFFSVAAALTLGARYTMLNPFGSLEQHQFALEDGEIETLVFDPVMYGERAAQLTKRAARLKRTLSLGPSLVPSDDLLADAATYTPERLTPAVEEGDVAVLQYTSGTTGRPKGVVLSHRAMAHGVLVTASQWEWPGELRFLALTQLAQALLVPVMLRGGAAVLESGIDPAVILATIERERITATYVVPALIYALLDHPGSGATDLSSLELIVYASTPIAPTRLAEAIGRFGDVFMQVYGQTEALFVTLLSRSDHDVTRTDLLGSCGRPLAGNDVCVFDDEGRRVAPGEIGEVRIRGRIVMDGYWNRPDLTARSLKDGWLHTGDLARQDPRGYISIVDRKDDTILLDGQRVFSREIEDLLAQHPAVASAAVFGLPDAQRGERIAAAVASRPGTRPSGAELIEFVRANKSDRHCPQSIQLIDALPLTAAGKPDKGVLRSTPR